MQSDLIFRLTNDHKRHEECLKILHGFSYRMIRERKEKILQEQAKKNPIDQNNNSSVDENGNVIITTMIDEEEDLGKKKRLAFLDLLINASGNGSVLTDEDIREEVDTFVSFWKINLL
jgi:cytochrome P450 family 4